MLRRFLLSLNRRHHENRLMIFMRWSPPRLRCTLIPCPAMRLRTRLNLVVTGLSTIFVIVLIGAEIQSSRGSVREEIEAANRVAAQLLGRLTIVYSEAADRDGLLQFLQQLGRVRANEISLVDDKGNELYRSPAATYKAGREAPAWFAELLAPLPVRQTFALRDGLILTIDAQPSRSILDAWDDITRLLTIAAIMLAVVSALAFGSVARALKPFPIIALGLKRIQEGDLTYRLPVLAGFEAGTIGAAFNRMAEAVQAKVLAEQKVHEAEVRLEERREMAYLTDQRVEEERRIIAHELHDELGQSVTAIRSLALRGDREIDIRGSSTALRRDARIDSAPDAAVVGFDRPDGDAGEPGARLAEPQSCHHPDARTPDRPRSRTGCQPRGLSGDSRGSHQCLAPCASLGDRDRGPLQRAENPCDRQG